VLKKGVYIEYSVCDVALCHETCLVWMDERVSSVNILKSFGDNC